MNGAPGIVDKLSVHSQSQVESSMGQAKLEVRGWCIAYISVYTYVCCRYIYIMFPSGDWKQP